MNHVLGVVHDEHVEELARPRLVQEDVLHDPVKAVGLHRRAVVRHRGAVHIGKPLAHPLDLGLGLRIVGVDADEDLEAVVVESVDGVDHHLGDDVGLAPGRHHDGHARLRPLEQPLQRRRRAPQGAHPFDQGIDPPAQVDEEVVHGRHENGHGHDDQQPVHAVPIVGGDLLPKAGVRQPAEGVIDDIGRIQPAPSKCQA